MIYERLAVKKKKTGIPIFVYWDKKCLNFGQDWENGFMNGLKTSQLIVLLVSTKVYSDFFLLLSLFDFAINFCYLFVDCAINFLLPLDIGRNHKSSN